MLTVSELRDELDAFAHTTLKEALQRELSVVKDSIIEELTDKLPHPTTKGHIGRGSNVSHTSWPRQNHAARVLVLDGKPPSEKPYACEERAVLLANSDEGGKRGSAKSARRTTYRHSKAGPPDKKKSQLYPDDGTFAGKVMSNPWFRQVTVAAVMVNVLFVAAQTQYAAVNVHDGTAGAPPPVFKWFGVGFCLFFCFEISVRIAYFRESFFCNTEFMLPNFTDLGLVVLQVLEEIIESFASAFGGLKAASFLRLVRILRLFRILRILRVVMSLGELRMIIVSISNSMRSLAWVMVLVFLLTFAVGVFLTQLTVEHRINAESRGEDASDALTERFGTLGRSILELYEAISQGTSCAYLLDPLMQNVSPFMSVPFVAYTSFVTFAMMNVITSSFVESAFRAATEDSNKLIIAALMEMFAIEKDMEHEEHSISRQEFNASLWNPQMLNYLHSMEMTPEYALEHDFFGLIDADGSGCVDTSELIDSCLRLRGPARAVDFAMFIHDYRLEKEKNRQEKEKLKKHEMRVEALLSEISQALGARPSGYGLS